MTIKEAISKCKTIYPSLNTELQEALDVLITSAGGDTTHCTECANRNTCFMYQTFPELRESYASECKLFMLSN